MPRRVDLTHRKINRWTVVSQAEHYKAPSGRLFVMWNVRCDCGKERVLRSSSLTSKSLSKSCGCYSEELTSIRSMTHNMSNSREYISWAAMKKRCTNPNDPSYKYYMGRGITVCSLWLDSFENFYKDMGDRPEGRSLDRIDNDKGYFKENCRWSTRKEQALNRGVYGLSKFRGVTWCNYYKGFCLSVKTGQKYYNFEEEAAEAYDEYIIKNNLPNLINKIEDYPVGYFKN